MDIREALQSIADGRDLSLDEMSAVMRQVMTGEATDAQIGAFLLGMRMKGESVDEITGAVTVMRELATPVPVTGDHLVDIVGTGGDGANLFNVSTAASFAAAAAGARVAKHGNRSVSSKSGAADLLEAAGVRLDLTPEQVAQCVKAVGIGFMFAPMHHSAMRHAIGPRKELGMRTLFNLLGPMTNPAGVKRMLIGVFDRAWARPAADVLGRLGAEHVLVVHSEDGLDEISLAMPTFVTEYRDGEIAEYQISPADLGLEPRPLAGLAVGGAEASLALIRAALDGDIDDAARAAADMIALNAGAAVYVAGLAEDLGQGVALARQRIESGQALARLEALAAFTRDL